MKKLNPQNQPKDFAELMKLANELGDEQQRQVRNLTQPRHRTLGGFILVCVVVAILYMVFS